jgi:hypothetical protein
MHECARRLRLATLRGSCSGTQFDPAIVECFEQLLADRAKSPTAIA